MAVIFQPISVSAEEERKASGTPLTAAEDRDKALKIKSAAPLPDGSILLGGKGGLCLLKKDGVVEPQRDFPKVEVKVIVPDELGRWWVATEEEVYVKPKGGAWEKVFPGEVRGIAAANDGSVLISIGGGVGVKRSRDGGKTWETVIALLPESMLPPPRPAGDKSEKPKG